METMEFIAYVRDLKRKGLSNAQIATRLGMDVIEFQQKCQAAYDEVEGVVKNVVKPAMEKKPVEKPVSGAGVPKEHKYEKKTDVVEEHFMNEPILKKETVDETEK